MRLDEQYAHAVVWVTNSAAPYRRPVWDKLAQSTQLAVRVLESDSQLARRGRRGNDWATSATAERATYEIRSVRTWSIGRGERVIYVLRGNLHVPQGSLSAVLLGGWESPAYWQTLAIARIRRARTVAFYESTLASQHHTRGIVAWARTQFFRSVDAVVVPGPAARDAVLSMGVDRSKIHTGFNAVDVAKFQRPPSPSLPPDRGHRYVYVGQLIERKNVHRLIQAFSATRESGDTLTIVGTGEDESALKQLVGDLALMDSITFTGGVPYEGLPAVLWQHHTLVLPSTEEVWGLVVNEGLAAGLHAVVSVGCGVAASVHHMTGVFTTPTDTESLASALSTSRASWTGPIDLPEILRHTPEEFASTFERALAGDSRTPS